MRESTKPIFVDNNNFIRFYKGIKNQSFGKRKYIVLYDNLNKKNKELLKSVKGDYIVEKWNKKKSIFTVLTHVFQRYDRNKVLEELKDFDNHYILIWLQGMSVFNRELADKVADIEKYVYSPYFKELIVYELEGMKCNVKWYRKQKV